MELEASRRIGKYVGEVRLSREIYAGLDERVSKITIDCLID